MDKSVALPSLQTDLRDMKYKVTPPEVTSGFPHKSPDRQRWQRESGERHLEILFAACKHYQAKQTLFTSIHFWSRRGSQTERCIFASARPFHANPNSFSRFELLIF